MRIFPRGLGARLQDSLKLLDRPLRLADDEVVGLVELLVDFPVVVVGERFLRVESPLPNFILFLLALVRVVIFQIVVNFWSKVN